MCQLVHLGDGDEDEGCALGVPLYFIVNHSRAVCELITSGGWFYVTAVRMRICISSRVDLKMALTSFD